MNARILTLGLTLFISQNLIAAGNCSLVPPKNPILKQKKTTLFSQILHNESLFKPGTQKRQINNYILPKAAKQLVAKKAAFLIDLRSPKDFQRLHIPGVLNIPAHSLKTKTFLKTKHLILFNEGHSYQALETLYLSLRKVGFNKLSILEGGLNLWHKEIGELVGDLRNLDKITPAQFFPERNYEHWRIVNISQQPLSSEIFNQNLNEIYLLITSERGKDYPKVQAKLRHLSQVFYLQGGVQGYRQFLQQQHNQSLSTTNVNININK